MIFPSFFATLLIAALAAAQDSNTTTYNVTISWYGTNDPKGSPNCNSNTVACGFYTYVRYIRESDRQDPTRTRTDKIVLET